MTSPVTLTEDELRRLTSSHSEWWKQIAFPVRRQSPLDNGQLSTRTVSPSSIGDLEILPLEAIHMILNLLNLQCLTDFRAVGWRARALVDSLPPYKAAIQHSPDAIHTLLSSRMAVYFTAQNVFEALYTEACFICGQFGPFLHLFTARRCCYTCVRYSDSLLSIPTALAKTKFNLTSEIMRILPTLLIISPGTPQRRVSLVHMKSAAAAGAAEYSISASREPNRGYDVTHRFKSVVVFPWLDRSTGNIDGGASCTACFFGPRDPDLRYENWTRVYSTSRYLEHYQKCQVA